MASDRRFRVPEVIQVSAMDCGPASLKAMLDGFGVRASYGRLREACQTEVDGTSIDSLEDVARMLGLDAEQILIPVDHVLLPSAEALPAVVVVVLPNGFAHFVVLWNMVGPFVQVMDPGSGRRWMRKERFLADLFVHQHRVPTDAWREWATSPSFLDPLCDRLAAIGVARRDSNALVLEATTDPSPVSLATLDAAARMVTALERSGGVQKGTEARDLVRALVEEARRGGKSPIPEEYYSVIAESPREGEVAPREVALKGAVLVRVRGIMHTPPTEIPVELRAALAESEPRPIQALWRLLANDGRVTPVAIILTLTLCALGGGVEIVLLRGLIDAGRELSLVHQRLLAIVVLLAFGGGIWLLEIPVAHLVLGLGRRLEVRLRAALLAKIPRLEERYFRSRPVSDMAERAHAIHSVRVLPQLVHGALRSFIDLLVTSAGLLWLAPFGWMKLSFALACVVVVPWLGLRSLSERDLRFRSHTGALSRFYLDALLGLVPVRTHGAEGPVRREHEDLLVEWLRTGASLQRLAALVEGLQSLVTYGIAALLFLDALRQPGVEPAAMLLVLYWALRLPVAGRELALQIRQYPMYRNIVLRLLEPLSAPEIDDRAGSADPSDDEAHATAGNDTGVRIDFDNVEARAGGRVLLEGITLHIAPREHVAIVGPSGAGKSTLVGMLLGNVRPSSGRLCVDGVALEGTAVARLRGETAWVDPAVQLWNRSLLDNVRYGATEPGLDALPLALRAADLRAILERLPEGLQTKLGEGGGLVSGGEGQRVRLGRAMLRPKARLVVLDEPFRGLDRTQRGAMLTAARSLWQKSTILSVTHDVRETASFARVLVVENGHIVEDGRPDALLARTDSRYRALVMAEEALHTRTWAHPSWRRLRLEAGQLSNGEKKDAPSLAP